MGAGFRAGGSGSAAYCTRTKRRIAMTGARRACLRFLFSPRMPTHADPCPRMPTHAADAEQAMAPMPIDAMPRRCRAHASAGHCMPTHANRCHATACQPMQAQATACHPMALMRCHATPCQPMQAEALRADRSTRLPAPGSRPAPVRPDPDKTPPPPLGEGAPPHRCPPHRNTTPPQHHPMATPPHHHRQPMRHP